MHAIEYFCIFFFVNEFYFYLKLFTCHVIYCYFEIWKQGFPHCNKPYPGFHFEYQTFHQILWKHHFVKSAELTFPGDPSQQHSVQGL